MLGKADDHLADLAAQRFEVGPESVELLLDFVGCAGFAHRSDTPNFPLGVSLSDSGDRQGLPCPATDKLSVIESVKEDLGGPSIPRMTGSRTRVKSLLPKDRPPQRGVEQGNFG